MDMVKKPVSELEGAQLDWAVAVADGQGDDVWLSGFEDVEDAETLERVPRRWCMVKCPYDGEKAFMPSEEWVEAGHIIQREQISILWVPQHGQWESGYDCEQNEGCGDTPMIAAMRAFVTCKLGDEVEVPL